MATPTALSLIPAALQEPLRQPGQQGRPAWQGGSCRPPSVSNGSSGRGLPVGACMGDAEEEHGAWHLFQHIGEVLRAHDLLVEAAEAIFAEQRPCGRSVETTARGSQIVTGKPSVTSTRAARPWAAAIPMATWRTRSCRRMQVARREGAQRARARRYRQSRCGCRSTSIRETVTTTGSWASNWRVTSVCGGSTRPRRRRAPDRASGAASMHGRRVLRPRCRTGLPPPSAGPRGQSPARGALGMTWSAKAASGSGSPPVPPSRPSSSMNRAPWKPSSPGWNMKRTDPFRSLRRAHSRRAAPTSIAVWVSCPQACIVPGMVEA